MNYNSFMCRTSKSVFRMCVTIKSNLQTLRLFHSLSKFCHLLMEEIIFCKLLNDEVKYVNYDGLNSIQLIVVCEVFILEINTDQISIENVPLKILIIMLGIGVHSELHN